MTSIPELVEQIREARDGLLTLLSEAKDPEDRRALLRGLNTLGMVAIHLETVESPVAEARS
jgi:hypothetical protein